MKEKEIAQRIMAMYHSQANPEDKQQFVQLLKDIVKIIEGLGVLSWNDTVLSSTFVAPARSP